MEAEDKTAKDTYNSVYNLSHGTMGIKVIRIVNIEQNLFDDYAVGIGLIVLNSDEWLNAIGCRCKTET